MYWHSIPSGNFHEGKGTTGYCLLDANENKIIDEDKDVQNARVYLTYATGKVLKQGAELLGMQMPEKM